MEFSNILPVRSDSVHPLPAVYCATVTRDLMLVVFKVEFVVVAQLGGGGGGRKGERSLKKKKKK